MLYILQVKIQGQNQEMLYAACQQFLGKSQEEIRAVALETLVRFQSVNTSDAVPLVHNFTLKLYIILMSQVYIGL